ncbi:MAG TPA: type II secretion system protein GspK [Methylocella sp.]
MRQNETQGLCIRAPKPESVAGTDGFIIVAVLWILAALAMLAAVYADFVAKTAVAARVYDSRLQSEALIAAGLELTAYRLLGYDDASRQTSGAFDFQLGLSHVGVEFRSEGARIDLNLAPKELLSGLCRVLGAKPEEADSYADRIVAWRTKPGPGNQNPEAEAYKSAGLNYGPRQAPFQNVAELRLVRDLPAVLVESALPFVTVFNGQAGIDVTVAAPQVVRALPGINPNLVDEIITRGAQNPQAVLPLLGAAGPSVAVGGRKAARALVHITLDTGRQVNADAVLLITENNSAEPYRVLAWHDDFDGPV